MTAKYDSSIATEIIESYAARPEMLVQILHAFVDRYGFISNAAMRQIADELNISRADIHGVVSYYHDFRTEPAGKRIVKICQAEACQAMGSRDLTAHVKAKFDIDLNETSADGEVTLEPAYCLGNCACSPAVMIDNKVYGRVDAQRFDHILETEGSPGD
jgi:formate dehydrogenase subunit gamma